MEFQEHATITDLGFAEDQTQSFMHAGQVMLLQLSYIFSQQTHFNR